MNYEISKGTLAIVPNGEETSLVYEDENRYYIKEKPFKIMEESCKYFGSSYDGRKESAKSILGAEYKVPIIVEDSENIVLFPTTSPRSSECAWISLRNIKSIEKIDAGTTKIVFNNDKNVIIPISYRSIENQISRASRLELIMNRRKIKK
ncbi:MAG: transcriptional regulator [Firmicutes bacterium]|nr:transcriptional regulator [Bacillota bacterium]